MSSTVVGVDDGDVDVPDGVSSTVVAAVVGVTKGIGGGGGGITVAGTESPDRVIYEFGCSPTNAE